MPWQRWLRRRQGRLQEALIEALEAARQGHPEHAVDLVEGSFRQAVDALPALGSPDETAWLQVAAWLHYRAGRMRDAAQFLEHIPAAERRAGDWHLLGRARLWLHDQRADRALAHAATLDRRQYCAPHRVSHKHFETLANRALGRIPPVFRERMQNTIVVVEDLPLLEAVVEGEDPDLLGLYEGGTALHDDFFERIVLYQRNHETIAADEAELAEQVEETMRHEIGHHFGMTEADLPY